MPEEAFFLGLAMFMTIAAGFVVLGPIGSAIGDRLRGRSAAVPPALQDQRDEVLTRLEDVQRQLGEVAERQEFTERLLAQDRAKGALGPGE